ncbi:MAG: antitoxin VapB family protein [Candidatus Nitrosocosmicus sp.]
MVKTITIKEDVFNKLTLQKGNDESLSDLFERLSENQVSGIQTLRMLRGLVEFDSENK